MKTIIMDYFESTSVAFPDKPAFLDEHHKLSFGRLLDASKRIASALIPRIPPRSPIAVLSGRHVYTPACFLGIAYSGCFYAPLDGAQPPHRLRSILEVLRPALIIADAQNEPLASSLVPSIPVITLEELLRQEINLPALALVRGRLCETDPLYVIFTSGSTGAPKGVITSHRALMCYIDAYCEVMQIDSSDRLGCQAPLDYIAAIRDIYVPLRTGASTYLISKQDFAVPGKLFDVLVEKRITSIGWSVSAMTLPTSMGAFSHCVPRSLKKVCFSGSVMPCKCLRIWQQHLPGARFVNQYGPTEATASCTYYEVSGPVSDTDVLPIGTPYKHYRVFLLNDDHTETATGGAGEICVAGPALALGYYKDPERTARSFIQNPLQDAYPERIYKTGDIGRLRPDGLLEFLGRKDRQIKHLGHRIELEEVEAAAGGLCGIESCAALYQQERELLYLFYTGTATAQDCAVRLRERLPGFMVPRRFVKLEKLPLLANGKTNMQTLKTYFK